MEPHQKTNIYLRMSNTIPFLISGILKVMMILGRRKCEEWPLCIWLALLCHCQCRDDLPHPMQCQGDRGYRNLEIMDNAMTRYRQNGQ